MDQNRKPEDKRESSEGVGRISNRDAEKSAGAEGSQTINDISYIDQQEGEMAHGSVGGNFAESDQEETNEG